MKNVFRAGLILFLLIVAFVAFWLICPKTVGFRSFEDLKNYVEGPDGAGVVLWRGTFYCGDKDGESLFRHKMDLVRDSWLTLPATEKIPFARFAYTRREVEWQGWRSVVKP
jgi:hypothetical protein